MQDARSPVRIAALIVLLVGIVACDQPAAPPTIAELVIVGADIRTADPRIPRASALAVAGGRVVAVGDDRDMDSWIGPGTDELRLDGATVLPGIVDAHVHLEEGLEPVRRAGRDPGTRERLDAYRDVQEMLLSEGVTSVHAMADLEALDDYVALLERSELSLRVWFGVSDLDAGGVDDVLERRRALSQRVEATVPGGAGPVLELGFGTVRLDGDLSTRTAALLEPYADDPHARGRTTMDADALENLVTAANAVDLPVAVHAVGDRAIRMSLDAFGAAPRPTLPNRIEHATVVHPADVARFAELDVVASMQPYRCIAGIHEHNEARLGPERARRGWAWQTLLDAGATLAFGSDWSTGPAHPMEQLYAAVVREKPGGGPPGGWHPEQAVSFDAWLHASTLVPARVSGWDDEIGSLTVGKRADLVILEGPVAEPVDASVRRLRVRATYRDGHVVFRRGGGPPSNPASARVAGRR